MTAFFILVVGISCFFYIDHLENVGGEGRVPKIIAVLYYLGGKWAVLFATISFALGSFVVMRKSAHERERAARYATGDSGLSSGSSAVALSDGQQRRTVAQNKAARNTADAVINKRYHCVDKDGSWRLGHPNLCIDSKDDSACLCVRVAVGSGDQEKIIKKAQEIAKLKIPGLIAPVSIVKVKSFSAASSYPNGDQLNAGDMLFVFNRACGEVLMRHQKSRYYTASPPFNELSRLANVFHLCDEYNVDLSLLDYQHIRLDEKGVVNVLAVIPVLKCGQDNMGHFIESTSVLSEDYKGVLHPTRLLAAVAATTLPALQERQDQCAHNGKHLVVASLPAKTNRLIASALNPRTDVKTLPPAEKFVKLLEQSFEVDLGSYLNGEQLNRLRNRQSLSDDTISQMIVLSLGYLGKDKELLYDQSPRSVTDDELAIALGHINSRKEDAVQAVNSQNIVRACCAIAALLTFIFIGVWWNTGTENVFDEYVDVPNKGALLQTVFTGVRYGSSFPTSGVSHLPHDSKGCFYAKINSGGRQSVKLRIKLSDQDGRSLGGYSHDLPNGGGYIYYRFLANGSSLEWLEAKVYVNNKEVSSRFVVIGVSFFGSFGNVFLLILLLWSAVGVLHWRIGR